MIEHGRSTAESYLVDLIRNRAGEFARGVVASPFYSLCDRLAGGAPAGVKVPQAALVQYPKQSSTQMFKSLADENVKLDLLHLDGRLTDEDMALLPQLVKDQTLFTLDDFEGLEKGVANAQRLMHTLGNVAHFLIYPPERDTLAHFGLRDGCTTAMLLPRCLFQITVQ